MSFSRAHTWVLQSRASGNSGFQQIRWPSDFLLSDPGVLWRKGSRDYRYSGTLPTWWLTCWRLHPGEIREELGVPLKPLGTLSIVVTLGGSGTQRSAGAGFCFLIPALVPTKDQCVHLHRAILARGCASQHVDHTAVKRSKSHFESRWSFSFPRHQTHKPKVHFSAGPKGAAFYTLKFLRVLPQGRNLSLQH